MIKDSIGSGKVNRNLMARIVEHEAKSERIMIFSVWICIPHARVMMQL